MRNYTCRNCTYQTTQWNQMAAHLLNRTKDWCGAYGANVKEIEVEQLTVGEIEITIGT